MLALLVALVAAAGYTAVGVYRDSRFGSNAFDLGNQMQTIWGYSQGRFIYNTVLLIPNLMGDHFHAVMLVLAPLYRVWPSQDLLFAVQAALLAAGAIPVYLLARDVVGGFGALCLELAYLLFWGILDGVIYDFHHVAFAVPALAWALYAVERRRDLLLVAMVVVAMLTREDLALTLVGLGVYIALIKRRWRLGAGLAIVNVAWFIFLLQFVLPALGGTHYRHWTYQALGPAPLGAARHVVLHPLSSIRLLVTPFQKVRLLGGLGLGWLALPLLSPVLIVAVPSLLERLWSSEATLWSLHFQYSMTIAPVLAIGTVDALRRLSRLRRMPAWLVRRAVPAAVLVVGTVTSFAGVRPFEELPTYVSAGYASAIQSCLDVIPGSAPVAASNFLLPHLANRERIYVFPPPVPVQYMAVDVATNHHFAAGEEAVLRANVRNALAAGYEPVCAKNLTLVLEAGAPGRPLPPLLQRWMAGTPAAKLVP